MRNVLSIQMLDGDKPKIAQILIPVHSQDFVAAVSLRQFTHSNPDIDIMDRKRLTTDLGSICSFHVFQQVPGSKLIAFNFE